MNEITVQYFNSACVGIRTPDLSILCDPWFTEGAFDGAWHTFPKIDDPLEKIGQFDYIWISHLHQDHYDHIFLKKYLDKYPQTEILIGVWDKPFMLNIMKRHGFNPKPVVMMGKIDTSILIAPSEVDPLDVDSALVVRWKDKAVVNLNDCLESEKQLERIKSFAPTIDIAMLGFTGAGPYPQCFYDKDQITEKMLQDRSATTLGRYLRVEKVLGARINIPFAGQYILAGKFTDLNPYRGSIDAVEVYNHDPKAVVLEPYAVIGTDSPPTKKRTISYEYLLPRRMGEVKDALMHYERDILIPANEIRWDRLFQGAYEHLNKKFQMSPSLEDYYFCIQYPSVEGPVWFCLNMGNSGHNYKRKQDVSDLSPRSEITLDYRHLFGLLTGVYHWDNANGASHLTVRRFPDYDNKPARQRLSFFHI